MTHSARDEPGTKVAFKLAPDATGYPPADWEHLWAVRLPNGHYSIDNAPFFAYGVCYGDVVQVEQSDGMNVFQHVVTPSSHSTLRVIAFDESRVADLRETLRKHGCWSELSHIPTLITVDVPPEVALIKIRMLLERGERAGYWEYEEAAIRHE